MRYIIFLFAVIFIVLSSCKSIKSNVTKQHVASITKVNLSEEDQRKFDYFFFEAIREKMKGNIQKSLMYYNECLKLDPTSAVTMYEMANIYYNVKEFVKAQGLLEHAVSLNHNNVWYKLLLAELYQMNKLNDNAIQIYKALVNDNPDNDEYLYGLAQLYQRNSNFQEAIDTYNTLESKIGLNEVISLEKEKIYLDLEKNKSALAELEKLVDKYPGESRYYGFIADYYFYLKDYENALKFYNKVLEIDPDNGLAFFSIANIDMTNRDTLNFSKNFEKGLLSKGLVYSVKLQKIVPLIVDKKDGFIKDSNIEHYFQLLIDNYPYESNGFIYYGNYLKSIKNSKGALDAFKSAIKIEPNNDMVWQEILFLEYDLKLFDNLIIDGISAIDKFSENPIFYLLTGSAYMQTEKYLESLKYLEEGIKYCGKNEKLKSQFYASIGDSYHSIGDSNTAFKYYDEALQIDELNLVVLNNFSYYLSLEKKDLKKAETMISRCVELEPGNSTYLDTYAWVMFQMERYFEAKYLIERALDNGGKVSDVILEHYGDILYKNGDTKEAVIQWKKAIELGDGSGKLKEKIEKGEYIE
jgi:tetratricopeptide (TPR) repeat protein